MPLFAYRAVSASGKVVKGKIDAREKSFVHRQLRRDGHLPVNVRQINDERPWWKFRPASKQSRKTRDLALATREIVLLLHAGQTIEQALRLLARTGPKSLQNAFAAVLANLREGVSLADALDAEGGFPPLYLAMVKAGEASGAMEEQLARLAEMLDRINHVKDILVSSTLYPIVLLCVAASAILLLLGVVVPQFAPLFADSPHRLPFVTRAVLWASNALRHYGFGAAIGVFLLVALLLPLFRRPSFQKWRDRMILKSPIFGNMNILMAVGRQARALAVLLKGGVGLPRSLALVRDISGNHILAAMIDEMRSGIKDGKGLTASLPPGHPLPELAVQLLLIGEQSGQLETSFLHIADIFETRLEQSLKRFLALLEPACVVLLSLVVGTVVVSILLAVVSINDLAL